MPNPLAPLAYPHYVSITLILQVQKRLEPKHVLKPAKLRRSQLKLLRHVPEMINQSTHQLGFLVIGEVPQEISYAQVEDVAIVVWVANLKEVR